MGEFPLSESAAWAIVSRPLIRPLYMHKDTWAREFKNVARQRRNWLRRVKRQPDGCWVWTGPTINRPNRAPILVYYVRPAGRHEVTKGRYRSAYWWMIREWFPEHDSRIHITHMTCGNKLCLSPLHRRSGSGAVRTKLTDEQAVEIYRQRYERSLNSLANEFGVTRRLVMLIWTGRSRADVTGHQQENLPMGQTP